MKKIAFFVEGQTEQFFLNKLLIEIAAREKIKIELQKFQGKGKPTQQIFPNNTVNPAVATHFALIYDCGGDESVKPRILENYIGLINTGYSQVVGIRDLFPLLDLLKLEDKLKNGYIRNGKPILPPLPPKCEIIVAVNEVEAWFIAECNHFQCIDIQLTNAFISSRIGFDPCNYDTTLFANPAEDLNKIYNLVGKRYNKSIANIEQTVQCLDYANLYLNVRNRISKLNDLITTIENFLIP
jgi:hypothetical protein